MKKLLLGLAGTLCGLALIFSITSPAQAAALTSSQVSAIINLLQSFGADASVVANVQATLTGQPGVYPTPPVNPICPQLLRTLTQGVSGSDVKELQAYLGVSQTGYFGPMTAQAVAQFQVSEGLSPVGVVGPATRAAFARRCGGGWNQNFSAYPTSGYAPLNVSFTASTGGSIDFGDGSSAQMFDNTALMKCLGACSPSWSSSHTYTSAGTYTAKLMYQPAFYCPPGTMCPMMMPAPQIVGTVTIYVGGSTSSGAPSISGLDAPTSLSVGQTGTWTVHASAPSGTQLRYSVVWGDEAWGMTTGAMQSAPTTVFTSGSFTHVYQNAGTYTPSFTVSNSSGLAKTSASVVVGGVQTPAFSASPTSGYTPLSVTFLARGGKDNYSISFGDGSTATMNVTGPMMGCPDSQTGNNDPACGTYGLSATHTYTYAGTYTATLYKNTCPSGAQCFVGPMPVGTVTITAFTGWL